MSQPLTNVEAVSRPVNGTVERTPAPSERALRLERGADGQLWATRGERALPVKVRRCFPWSHPDRYIALQTAENEELAFVSDPDELEATSRAALRQALTEAAFVFQIEKVHSIQEDFELRCFVVQTPQGRRAFQTALDAWPRETSDGGLLIEDVAGDLFRIDDADALDPKSRELIWELVD
jgi:Domain of unknown function (DUF1854)